MRNPQPSYDDLRYENLVRRVDQENARLRRELEEVRGQTVGRTEFKTKTTAIIFGLAITVTGLLGIVLYLITRR